jgi:hypothetical protein
MPEVTLPTSEIFESQQSAWETNLQPAGCPRCGQAFLVEPDRLDLAGEGAACPACGTGKLEPQAARLRPEPPELVIPFSQSRPNLNSLYQRFVTGVWLRPDDLNPQSLLRRATPVYWPTWLVDSRVSGSWQAEVGYDYQVESSQDSFVGGQWRSQKVVETRIRWEPRLGQIEHHFENIRTPALSEHNRLTHMIGEYRPQDAQGYQPAHLAGTVVRVPDLPPESAWPVARSQIKFQAGELCQQAAHGQHVRNFQLEAEYQGLNWTQLYLPLYVSYYTDDKGQPQFVYINPSDRHDWRGQAGLAAQRLAVGWHQPGPGPAGPDHRPGRIRSQPALAAPQPAWRSGQCCGPGVGCLRHPPGRLALAVEPPAASQENCSQ